MQVLAGLLQEQFDFTHALAHQYRAGGRKCEVAVHSQQVFAAVTECVENVVVKQVQIEVPWLSYVGDYEEGEGLCRVYGYTLNDHGFPVPYAGSWLAISQLAEDQFVNGWELTAARHWLDPAVIRGKGLSQAQSRIDQFAY